MSLSVIIFSALTAFAIILFAYAPEAPSLVLLFSAINSMIASFLKFEISVCATVFVVSFFVIFTFSTVIAVAIDKAKRRKQNIK